EVFRILRNAGERGLLAQFPAVIIGRPKATSLAHPTSQEERRGFREDQRDAVLRAFDRYAPNAMVVFGVDIGHTDPQYVLPYGGLVTIDGQKRCITAHY
ncbi:peptidase U61 LD-carboxypeptidase A, partial [mine drainage metagenome]